MLDRKTREIVVTGWILRQDLYKELLGVDDKIRKLVYDISWRGIKEFRETRISEYLDYNHSLDVGHYFGYDSDYWRYYHSYSRYKDTRVTMFDYTKVTLTYKVILLPKTLHVNLENLDKRDDRRLRALLGRKRLLVKTLVDLAESITEVLLNPIINMTYIKKYYPELL